METTQLDNVFNFQVRSKKSSPEGRCSKIDTPPKTNMVHLKMWAPWKRKILLETIISRFQPLIFWGCICFCYYLQFIFIHHIFLLYFCGGNPQLSPFITWPFHQTVSFRPIQGRPDFRIVRRAAYGVLVWRALRAWGLLPKGTGNDRKCHVYTWTRLTGCQMDGSRGAIFRNPFKVQAPPRLEGAGMFDVYV